TGWTAESSISAASSMSRSDDPYAALPASMNSGGTSSAVFSASPSAVRSRSSSFHHRVGTYPRSFHRSDPPDPAFSSRTQSAAISRDGHVEVTDAPQPRLIRVMRHVAPIPAPFEERAAVRRFDDTYLVPTG